MHSFKLWHFGFILLGFVMSLGLANANQYRTSPWVTTSTDRHHLFKMSLIEPENKVYQGICYKIDRQGELNEIWRTAPWYCGAGNLGPQGRYFVRWGYWARDREELSDLAVAFYDKGELLKEYKVADLIKHPEAIRHRIGLYLWRAFNRTTPDGISGSTFHLTLIDKTTYSFDITTGKILKKGHDVNASGPDGHKYRDDKDLRKLHIEADEMESRFSRLFDTQWSNFKAILDQQNLDSTLPSDFQLRPKEELSGPAVIEGIWQSKTDPIQPNLKPEDYLNALKSAFAHPHVVKEKRLNQSTRLRLKTSTTHPHQDSVTLRKLFRETYEKELPDEELSQWVEFDFIPIKPRPPFYLNRVTGKTLSQNDLSDDKDN